MTKKGRSGPSSRENREPKVRLLLLDGDENVPNERTCASASHARSAAAPPTSAMAPAATLSVLAPLEPPGDWLAAGAEPEADGARLELAAPLDDALLDDAAVVEAEEAAESDADEADEAAALVDEAVEGAVVTPYCTPSALAASMTEWHAVSEFSTLLTQLWKEDVSKGQLRRGQEEKVGSARGTHKMAPR